MLPPSHPSALTSNDALSGSVSVWGGDGGGMGPAVLLACQRGVQGVCAGTGRHGWRGACADLGAMIIVWPSVLGCGVSSGLAS